MKVACVFFIGCTRLAHYIVKNNPSDFSITGVSQAVEHINSTIAPALVGQVRRYSSLPVCFERLYIFF